jgi:hypothetical protein
VVPNTWLSVPFFFLFVAPGALFNILSRQRRVPNTESAFLEISRIALASLGFSTAAFLVIALVRQERRSWVPEPRQLLGADSAAYFRERYGLVLWTFAIGAGLACLFAWLFHLALFYKQGWQRIRPVSAWQQAMKLDQPEDTDVYARVRLEDGLVYYGRVCDFSADLETEGRELVLTQPMQSGKLGDDLQPVPVQYARVVIPGDSIKVLSVEYQDKSTTTVTEPTIPSIPPSEATASVPSGR